MVFNLNAYTGYSPAFLEEGCLSDYEWLQASMQIMLDQHRWMSTNFNLSLQEEDGQERPDVEQELDLVGFHNIQNLRTKTRGFKIVSL